MARIFISYRREDSDIWVGRLADDLRRHFAPEQIFQDVASIDPGAPFQEVLDKALATAAAMLVVIGPRWLSATDKQGRKRLEQPVDLVRQEVAESLRRPGVRVFPLLVGGAEMPADEDLPEPLKSLAQRHALELTVRHWTNDFAQLVRTLERVPGLADDRKPDEHLAGQRVAEDGRRRELEGRAAKEEARSAKGQAKHSVDDDALRTAEAGARRGSEVEARRKAIEEESRSGVPAGRVSWKPLVIGSVVVIGLLVFFALRERLEQRQAASPVVATPASTADGPKVRPPGPEPGPDPAPTTLTYSSWVPPQHHLSIWQANWTAEVEKATGGRVKFQVLPKHPLAPPGTFDAVRDGLVDLSYVTASYTPVRHVMPLMPELPGAGDTSVVNSIAYSRIHWKHFHKLGEYKGVKLLGVFTHGPGHLFTKKRVGNINDIKGLKIRTGGGVAEALANAIGASALVKPAPESYELLKSGVADGVFFPLESVVSFKLDPLLEQATLFPGGLYSSAFGFFMNQDKWDKLSKQDQAIIEKLAFEHVARTCGLSWDTADQRGLGELKKSGIRIVSADGALLAEVQKHWAPIIDDWVKKASAKGVDAKAILAEFQAELRKVAAAERRY